MTIVGDKQTYFRNRYITKHRCGFFVIVPEEAEQAIPICCPVCTTMMRTKDDEYAWANFNCCDRCSLSWAAARRKEWSEGWRPDQQSLSQEIEQRPPMVVNLEID